jgi:hypothetical protein
MKKLVLVLLTLGLCTQAHTQIVQDAKAVLTTAFTYSKTLVTQHPYITAAVISCAAVISAVVYVNSGSKQTDPSFANSVKDELDDTVVIHKPVPLRVKSISPTDSPGNSPATSPAYRLQKLAEK